MKNFWIQFAVSSAVSAAEAAVLSSGLTPAQKEALANLISAGQAVELAFTHVGAAA
jgi:hypothetical protein